MKMIRMKMAFFLFLRGKLEAEGRSKMADWALRQYRKYRMMLSLLRKPLLDRRDDIDRLGLVFRTLRIRPQRGITFEEFVRQVQSGAWTP
ncbi:hypothetical protein NYE69_28215 [Paenibacillus sp. FSL R5-0527]|uniref:hypothetical protein n=1 Tax=Paenibacillus sp. FSL R5-0527 TaxID=2975321 RepID=UPI000979F29B|nr:hypothetical protein BK140_11190 [Paenibacillus macerans]